MTRDPIHTSACKLVIAFIVAASAPPPLQAQDLSDGDYEICKVFDRRGEFVGFDSVCLAERRAALRFYGEGTRRFSPAYFCPRWANGGNGYNATFFSDGRPAALFGTWDSTMNGRPCLPRPIRPHPGYY
ncbi:hypothetical protein [Kordiimonas aestuarii]|uniref:hypothetical protein n=1 Tax=Kordiimonas aestuarii TaxID=1005925 RepID=UPI0021D01728|nr:hypothetical protein [Kordiimonas aestuarii]